MVTKFGVGQDSQSEAALRSAMAGNERSPIPGEVDGSDKIPVDAGTSIPSQVDGGILPPKVDRGS